MAVSANCNKYPVDEDNEKLSSMASYLFSNETLSCDTLGTIKEIPMPGTKKLHIGFGFWFNLDLIAQRKSDYVVIFDIDPTLAQFYYCLSLALRQSISRIDFLELFIVILRRYNLVKSIHAINNEQHLRSSLTSFLTAEGSWLNSVENYQFVKKIFVDERIIFSLFNISDSSKQQQVFIWLSNNRHRFSLDTLYLTNIYE